MIEGFNHHPRRLRPGELTRSPDDGLWYLASHPGEGLHYRELPEFLQAEADRIRAPERRRARWLALAALTFTAILATTFAQGGAEAALWFIGSAVMATSLTLLGMMIWLNWGCK